MAAAEVPLDELERRLAPLGVTGLSRLTGGASSLTYAGIGAGRSRVVVKVAPAGVPPTLNRDVLRQSRLLRCLGPTAVPVPEVLWEDGGDPPAVPPLFVTSFVEGSSVEPLYDADGSDPPAVVAERLRTAARVMAALHAVTPVSVDLGEERVVTPGEEVDRWVRLLETLDPALVPGWSEVADALQASLPAPVGPAVVHGDFRLGNMLAVGAAVTAVIDWEIWTVGDPRVDLGWFLINADPATYTRSTPYVGLTPGPDELAAVYGDVADRGWFEALALFKSAATWGLIVKHNRRRTEPDPEYLAMADVLPDLLARARRRL